MKEWIIRLGNITDLEKLIPMYQNFYNLHWQGFLKGNNCALEKARELVNGYFLRKNSWILIAQSIKNGEILGFSRLEERDECFYGCETYIHLNFRGRGLGKDLYKKREELAMQKGALFLFISIVPNNQKMLSWAIKQGYDTLNTLELKKELKKNSSSKPKEIVEFKGNRFKI